MTVNIGAAYEALTHAIVQAMCGIPK